MWEFLDSSGGPISFLVWDQLCSTQNQSHSVSPESHAWCLERAGTLWLHRPQFKSQFWFYGLCDCGQLASSFWASVFSPVKWGCVHAKSLQSCPTLCDPVDHSQPDSSVHGILQARILEWVAMPSFGASSQPRDWTHVSYISCIGRWVFLPLMLLGKPFLPILPQANPLMYLNLRVPHLQCQPHRTVVMIKKT